jgi:L-lactate utilization protein LutB
MNDIKKTIEALSKKGFKAVYAKNTQDAVSYVLSVIGENDTVGMGGSMTLFETGIANALVNRGNTIYSSDLAVKTGGDTDAAKRNGMTADVYLTSTNALTLEGDLVNIDGRGNRVAAMIYGPQKVIFITGKNKLTANPHTAVARIKKVACPQNARRLGLSTPCATQNHCTDCDSEQRMCNVTMRLQRPTRGKEMHVVVIDGDFGY